MDFSLVGVANAILTYNFLLTDCSVHSNIDNFNLQGVSVNGFLFVWGGKYNDRLKFFTD